jgi:hypothetical protein
MLKDIDFDFVIISRFDIEFNDFKIFEQLNYNKLNFMFKESNMWDSNQFVSDVLFAFPKIYLQSMIDSVVDVISDIRFINYDFLHNIYKFIEPRINANYCD